MKNHIRSWGYWHGIRWIIWCIILARRTRNPVNSICTLSKIPSTRTRGGKQTHKKSHGESINTRFVIEVGCCRCCIKWNNKRASASKKASGKSNIVLSSLCHLRGSMKRQHNNINETKNQLINIIILLPPPPLLSLSLPRSVLSSSPLLCFSAFWNQINNETSKLNLIFSYLGTKKKMQIKTQQQQHHHNPSKLGATFSLWNFYFLVQLLLPFSQTKVH